jgi:hypothetical protein
MKLLAYCLFGFVIYQLYKGMTEGAEGGQRGQGSGGGWSAGEDLGRALNEDTGRMQNMTGTGRGTTVSTEDNAGTSVPHVVGRGVTQP